MLRIVNGIRKAAAGLRPFNESVWPGVRNDLFVAHESIYHFAASFARGKRVLDAGCGTGYGSSVLGDVAVSVIGVDIDARSVGYARRHFKRPGVSFEVMDLENIHFEGSFDLVEIRT
jgi:2-polyprenyl-3-methyl-5-hydroxy-6-metoxy-1,4-benzoquinol methylase